MRIKTLLFLFISVLISANSFGQGAVRGVVKAAEDGSTLPAAAVIIKGTTIGTVTDLEGEYRMSLKPGEYILQASYIGYKTMDKEVTIVDGQDLQMEFLLEVEAIMGEEVVVTAMLRGQKSAISQQLSADGVVTIVSEEQIQELPDANAAEALGRLPGISVERSGGEAQRIVLRGMESKYTKITLDGVALGGTNSEDRGVDLSLISQGSLGNIEVVKALTPDLEGDALAGEVKLVTKKAPAKQTILGAFTGGYNGIDNSFRNYKAALKYSRRFFGNRLGFQAFANAEDIIRSRERLRFGYLENDPSSSILASQYGIYRSASSLNISYTDASTIRRGGNVILDYNTREGGSIRFNNNYYYTERSTTQHTNTVRFFDNTDYEISDAQRKVQNFTSAIIGENYLGAIKINWGVSISNTNSETPYSLNLSLREGDYPVRAPGDTEPVDTFRASGHNYPEPTDAVYATYPWHLLGQEDWIRKNLAYTPFSQGGNSFNLSKSEDKNRTGYLDLERTFNFSNNISFTLKGGGRYTEKHRNLERRRRTSRLDTDSWENTILDREITSNDVSGAATYELEDYGFLNGHLGRGNTIPLLPFVDESTMWEDWRSANVQSRDIFDGYSLNPLIKVENAREFWEMQKNATEGSYPQWWFDPWEQVNDYSIVERTTAGYLMGTLQLGKMIRLLGGFRYESDNNDYQGYWEPLDPGVDGRYITAPPRDSTTNFKQDYFLPNFHIKVKPLDWFDARFSLTRTISRPNFNWRLPTIFIDQDFTTWRMHVTNPQLRSATSTNYDLVFSFYKSELGLFSVNLFKKDIEDISYMVDGMNIIQNTTLEELGFPAYMEDGRPINNVQATLPLNIEGSTNIQGIELDLQTNLVMLPGFLKYVVLRGNVTMLEASTYYIRSSPVRSAGFPPTYSDSIFEAQDKLTGQPRFFFNVAVGYDRGKFSGRLSLYYQDDYFQSVSPDVRNNVMTSSFTKMDLSLKYDVNEHLSIIADASNLLQLQDRTYYEYENLWRSIEEYGTTAQLTVRVIF